MGPRAGLDGRKSRPHRDSIPDLPARSSVAIPTELPGPLARIYWINILVPLHLKQLHATEKEPYLILQPESESHYTVASGVSRRPCRMSLKSHKEKFNLLTEFDYKYSY